MLKKFILFNNLQHYIDHYWASLDMAEVDALSAMCTVFEPFSALKTKKIPACRGFFISAAYILLRPITTTPPIRAHPCICAFASTDTLHMPGSHFGPPEQHLHLLLAQQRLQHVL